VVPRLVIEKGRQRGKSIKVDKTSAIVVGRGNSADLQLDDPMASRRHFSVEFKKGNYYIIDLGSANGTYLNGEDVQEHILEIGDKVQAGEGLLSFLAAQSTLKHDTVTGQKIAGYLIEERVGRGAMGTVYKATQLSLERTVALKILARELVNDRNFIDMFVKEAQNAGQLNHPNIVQVYDVGRHQDIYFISMEYMTGSSVYELINREGAQPFERALRIAIDSARGLRYAEKKGIVHRDIKPDNLMLTVDGVTKIGDLGIAKRMTSGSAVLEEGIFGSPHYMAPEQAQRLKLDSRTDIYSLGATMYHLLSGQTPFQGKSPQEIILQQINKQARELAEVSPMVSPEFVEVVEKCMEKDPDERFGNVEELVQALESLEKKAGVVRTLPSLKERARKMKKKFLLPLIVILIAAAAAATGFFVYRHLQHSGQQHKTRLLEAQKVLEEAQADFDANKPDDALKKLSELRKNYPELAGVRSRADKLAREARKLREALAGQERQQQAAKALAEVEAFERSNPDKLEEIAHKYARVAADFAGTKAAQDAKTKRKRLDEIIEEKGVLEVSARAQANAVLGRARNFKVRKRYGRALEALDAFPDRYSGTEAAKGIEAQKGIIMKEARDAFALVKADAERLISRRRYEDAGALVLRAINTYEVPEITDAGSKVLKRIDNLKKQLEAQQRRVILARDKKRYDEAVAKARKMILEHQFSGASTEYHVLLPFLKSKKYCDSTQIKIDGIELIKAAKKTLVNQINSKTLRRSIKMKINKRPATAIRATDEKLIAKFDNVKAQGECYWDSFEAQEMVSFLDACSLDARGCLAAGVYAKELGDSTAAKRHFNKALAMDATLKAEIGKYSGDIK
jgi:serine/threonine-protein kinase